MNFWFQQERSRRPWVGEFWLPLWSQIMQGPIWAGNNTFLVSACNLIAFGRDLALCESPGRISHTQQITVQAHTHTPGWKKESNWLSSTHGAADTALPPKTIGSPGQRVISICAPFHPKPVLLFLNVKQGKTSVLGNMKKWSSSSLFYNPILLVNIHLPSQVVTSQSACCSSSPSMNGWLFHHQS